MWLHDGQRSSLSPWCAAPRCPCRLPCVRACPGPAHVRPSPLAAPPRAERADLFSPFSPGAGSTHTVSRPEGRRRPGRPLRTQLLRRSARGSVEGPARCRESSRAACSAASSVLGTSALSLDGRAEAASPRIDAPLLLPPPCGGVAPPPPAAGSSGWPKRTSRRVSSWREGGQGAGGRAVARMASCVGGQEGVSALAAGCGAV